MDGAVPIIYAVFVRTIFNGFVFVSSKLLLILLCYGWCTLQLVFVIIYLQFVPGVVQNFQELDFK